jgi:hypothetical protein
MSARHREESPMDQRIESFPADVLVFAGKELNAIRQEVRVALGEYEARFRAAARCAALASWRVMQRRRGRRLRSI